MLTLAKWEDHFQKDLQKVDTAKRQTAGALLSAIPSREKWDEFLGSVKVEWQAWRRDPYQLPHCLVVLYGGLAFYEYDENRFWPEFAKAVGSDPLPANQQGEINSAFANATRSCGLKIRRREDRTRTYYVDSTVHHIGVPLSLWDGFLEVCEWALLQDNWKELSDEEWAEVTAKRAGSRTRLKNFLLDNKDSASTFIQEMLDARKILTEEQHLTINDLKQASLLRQEYFDEVPETAEFLRPVNPESLFQDRARLVWDEQRSRVSLHLPAVDRDKLPAIWKIGTYTQDAAPTPDTLALNSAAFAPLLFLNLESGEESESQRLRGISPWGLFDLEQNRFVNPERQQLPIHSYMLISPKKLDDISRRGFDEAESPANELYELEDGTVCYVTRLWPVEKHAEISLAQAGIVKKLNFRSSFKIDARIFAGEGSYAANFSRYKEYIKTERLPLLCVAVPFGSFQNTESVLQRKFLVNTSEQPTDGKWEKRHEDDNQEYYFWRWADELQLRKKVSISIKAPELGIRFEYQIEMLLPKTGMAECWQNLPGAFLPWVLLVQPTASMKEGMKWNDLMLAKEAIAPGQPSFSESLLRKYARYGLLVQRGQIWMIAESRAVLEPSAFGGYDLRFSGNPAVLWSLFRYVHDQVPGFSLPVIEVINKRGDLPFLLMQWREEQRRLVKKYLENPKHNVRIVSDLWRP